MTATLWTDETACTVLRHLLENNGNVERGQIPEQHHDTLERMLDAGWVEEADDGTLTAKIGRILDDIPQRYFPALTAALEDGPHAGHLLDSHFITEIVERDAAQDSLRVALERVAAFMRAVDYIRGCEPRLGKSPTAKLITAVDEEVAAPP